MRIKAGFNRFVRQGEQQVNAAHATHLEIAQNHISFIFLISSRPSSQMPQHVPRTFSLKDGFQDALWRCSSSMITITAMEPSPLLGAVILSGGEDKPDLAALTGSAQKHDSAAMLFNNLFVMRGKPSPRPYSLEEKKGSKICANLSVTRLPSVIDDGYRHWSSANSVLNFRMPPSLRLAMAWKALVMTFSSMT